MESWRWRAQGWGARRMERWGVGTQWMDRLRMPGQEDGEPRDGAEGMESQGMSSFGELMGCNGLGRLGVE